MACSDLMCDGIGMRVEWNRSRRFYGCAAGSRYFSYRRADALSHYHSPYAGGSFEWAQGQLGRWRLEHSIYTYCYACMAMPTTMSVPPPLRLRPTACSTFDANFLAIYNTFRTPFTLTSMTMRPSSWLSAVISKKTRGRPIFELLENWRMQHRNRFDIRTVKRRATDFRRLSNWQGCFGRNYYLKSVANYLKSVANINGSATGSNLICYILVVSV